MPAPSRRNVGASLAHKIGDHSAARGAADDRDRLVASRARQDKKWEENAARLDSTLEQRADQARIDYERGLNLDRYERAVTEGRAKPPERAKPPVVVLTPQAEPRYFFGECLRCDREIWGHKAKPRVPICEGCR